MRLDKQCGGCGSWMWCGRQCKNAPGQIVQKPSVDISPPVIERKREVRPIPPKPERQIIDKSVKQKTVRAKQSPPNSIRFPKEVLEYFQKDGAGWQSRINDVLMNYVQEKK